MTSRVFSLPPPSNSKGKNYVESVGHSSSQSLLLVSVVFSSVLQEGHRGIMQKAQQVCDCLILIIHNVLFSIKDYILFISQSVYTYAAYPDIFFKNAEIYCNFSSFLLSYARDYTAYHSVKQLESKKYNIFDQS